MSLSSFNCQFRKLTGENPRKMLIIPALQSQ